MLVCSGGGSSYHHHPPPLFLSLAAFLPSLVYHVRVCRAQRGNAAGSGGGSLLAVALLSTFWCNPEPRLPHLRGLDRLRFCCFRPFIPLAPSTPSPSPAISFTHPSTGPDSPYRSFNDTRACAHTIHAELRRKSTPPSSSYPLLLTVQNSRLQLCMQYVLYCTLMQILPSVTGRTCLQIGPSPPTYALNLTLYLALCPPCGEKEREKKRKERRKKKIGPGLDSP